PDPHGADECAQQRRAQAEDRLRYRGAEAFVFRAAGRKAARTQEVSEGPYGRPHASRAGPPMLPPPAPSVLAEVAQRGIRVPVMRAHFPEVAAAQQNDYARQDA